MEGGLERQLQEKMGGSLDEAVEGKIAEFGGLLSRQSAILLLCRQNGISTERKLSLSDAKDETLPFSFEAKVDRIFPLQRYEGRNSVSLRVHVSGKEGEGTLVLWNERAKEAEHGLLVGDSIECSGAYMRNREIVLGHAGMIRKAGSQQIRKVSEISYGVCNAEGIVGEIEPECRYVNKKTGEEKAFYSFSLCEGKDCRRVVVWQNQEKPSAGERLLLENVFFKNGELHFGSHSRMVKKGHEKEMKGEIGDASLAGGHVKFRIGKDEFSAPVDEALLLLKIGAVPEGVMKETLVGIKLGQAVGKKATYSEEGIISIEID